MIAAMPHPVRYGPSLQLPTRYRDANGVERLAGRRCAMSINGRFYCPERHRINDTAIGLEEDTYRCHWKHRTGGECGILLYVIAHFTARDGSELLWAAEVTRDEIQRMRRMTLADKLEYLEVTWAGIG